MVAVAVFVLFIYLVIIVGVVLFLRTNSIKLRTIVSVVFATIGIGIVWIWAKGTNGITFRVHNTGDWVLVCTLFILFAIPGLFIFQRLRTKDIM